MRTYATWANVNLMDWHKLTLAAFCQHQLQSQAALQTNVSCLRSSYFTVRNEQMAAWAKVYFTWWHNKRTLATWAYTNCIDLHDKLLLASRLNVLSVHIHMCTFISRAARQANISDWHCYVIHNKHWSPGVLCLCNVIHIIFHFLV